MDREKVRRLYVDSAKQLFEREIEVLTRTKIRWISIQLGIPENEVRKMWNDVNYIYKNQHTG